MPSEPAIRIDLSFQGVTQLDGELALVAVDRAGNTSEQSEPVAVNPAFRLRLPDEERYEAALLAAVRKAIDGGDAAASLAEAAAAWEALASPEARRAAYRRSVNLQ